MSISIFTFFFLACISIVISHYINLLDEEKQRKDAIINAHLVKHQIETSLSNALSATNMLALVVENVEDSLQYNQLCKTVYDIYKNVDAVELGPNGIVRYAYPYKENKDAIGFNILKDPVQKDEALLAIKNKQLLFAGPLNLKQGGVGVVGRLPIFIAKNGTEHFWGFSLVVIKIHSLFTSAHIGDLDSLGYVYKFSRLNPVTNEWEVFFGKNARLDNPVEIDMDIPNSHWKLSLAPLEGWKTGVEERFYFLLGIFLSLLVGIIVFMILREPKRLKVLVEKSTNELLQKNQESTLLADISFRLAQCSSEDEVFTVVASSLRELLPKSVTVVMKFSTDEQTATVIEVNNLDSFLFSSAVSIVGFNPIGKSFAINPDFTSKYCTSALYRFENGLYELSSSVLSKFVSDRIESLLHIEAVYTIGLMQEEYLFGYIHIFQLKDSEIIDVPVIETIIHQCSLTLSNIRSHRLVMESEKRYRGAILQANAVPYVKQYDKNYYSFMPQEIEVLTGYPPRDITPALFRSIVLEYVFKNEMRGLDKTEAVQKNRSGEIPHWSVDYKIKTKTGIIKWISDSSIQMVDEKGLAFGSIGILQDITDRKSAEEEIKKLNADLEHRVEQRTAELTRANKELEAFSYSVSHDLRAPLRAIDGFSSLLMEHRLHSLDDEGKRLFTLIRTNIHKMDQLIDGLLTLSRIGRKELIHKEINMQGEAASAFNGVVSEQDRSRIQLTIDPLPSIKADDILLPQVWTNLISNAVKYSGQSDRPIIHIGAIPDEHSITYFVKDNGAGFNQENVDKLFGIFQRLHSVSEFPGIGVGLSIVKRIIERHGGIVWAEGKENEGATFYFSLPLIS